MRGLGMRGGRMGVGLLGAMLVWAAGAVAQAPLAAFPMERGQLVATCFSGWVDPQIPDNPNPNGFVIGVMDARIPPVDPNSPIPALDTNWAALMFHNEPGPANHRWDESNLGQVFGVCLDDADPPNIYTTATTLYGLFPFGPGGPGAVYRIDGVTAEICVLAQLPNTGPALGNICHDPVSGKLFVSNFEDGIIYAIDPRVQGGCGVQPVPAYDHGVNGRPNDVDLITNAPLLPIPDDPSTDFTPRGRRVWGLEVFQGRLYYGVWWTPTSAPERNDVWSVALDSAGNINASTARREVVLPTGTNSPVSDINFSNQGNMFLSERSMHSDFGNLHLGFPGSAHNSRLLKYEGAPGSWTLSTEEYRVGSIFDNKNSAGGAAIDCEENVWASGDALHFGSSTGHSDLVYGVQRIPAGGNAADSPATANSYLIGYGSQANGFGKTEIGDVEIYRDICECMEISHEEVTCEHDGDGALYTFDVTNNSGIDAAFVLFTAITPGLTITPNVVAQPLADGDTATLSVQLSGFPANEPYCFYVTLLSRDGVECCTIEICLDEYCDCLDIREERIACDPANPGSYIYTFDFVNLTEDDVEHVFLIPDDAGITVSPNYFDLPTLVPGASSGPLTAQITGGQAGDIVCFLITVHVQDLSECCALEHCVELPDCCTGEGDPFIELHGDFPQVVDCNADFQPPAAVAYDDCGNELEVQVEGHVDTSVPGEYCVTYTATAANGNTTSITYCVTVLNNCCDPDTEAPVIVLLAPMPEEVDCRGEFDISRAIARDDCDDEVEVKIDGEVDTSVPGQYCITYTATDASGNSSSLTHCVTVLDNCCDPDVTIPEITLLTPFPSTLNCREEFDIPRAIARDECDGELEVTVEGTVDTSVPGIYCVTYTATDSSGNTASVTVCVTVLNNCFISDDPVARFHSADTNQDYVISLSELLRVIQLFAAGAYHCDPSTEDGFAPGPGSHEGEPHSCDYNAQDWAINLAELLRTVQLYNAGGYHPCDTGEDTFCPGRAQ